MHAFHHPSATNQAKRPIEQVRRNGSYGIDAPYLLPILARFWLPTSCRVWFLARYGRSLVR